MSGMFFLGHSVEPIVCKTKSSAPAIMPIYGETYLHFLEPQLDTSLHCERIRSGANASRRRCSGPVSTYYAGVHLHPYNPNLDLWLPKTAQNWHTGCMYFRPVHANFGFSKHFWVRASGEMKSRPFREKPETNSVLQFWFFCTVEVWPQLKKKKKKEKKEKKRQTEDGRREIRTGMTAMRPISAQCTGNTYIQ